MLYRTIKKNGDNLSILGYGAMRLPEKGPITTGGGNINKTLATRQIRHAIDQGVNFIDTAFTYHSGKSESFVGEALSDGYRERVRISTKLPPWLIHNPKDMDSILNTQLKMLKTDTIDYYFIHGLYDESWQRMKDMGVMEFLVRAAKDGRIRYPGFSFHGSGKDFKAIVDDYDWVFCLIQYNYLDETNQAGTQGLRYAASKGMGVMIMEPLRGGNLSLKTPREIKAIWEKSAVKRTPAEWALRWVWNQPEVTVVLSGMNNDDHIEENIKIASEALPGSLSGEELKLIESARDSYKRLMKIACTGCRYCMPCPEGVNIPACFEHYNSYHMFNKMVARYLYVYQGAIGRQQDTIKKAYASQCVACKKCIEHCPQQLDIPELLEQVSNTMEGVPTKLLEWILSYTTKKSIKQVIREQTLTQSDTQ